MFILKYPLKHTIPYYHTRLWYGVDSTIEKVIFESLCTPAYDIMINLASRSLFLPSAISCSIYLCIHGIFLDRHMQHYAACSRQSSIQSTDILCTWHHSIMSFQINGKIAINLIGSIDKVFNLVQIILIQFQNKYNKGNINEILHIILHRWNKPLWIYESMAALTYNNFNLMFLHTVKEKVEMQWIWTKTVCA